MSRCLTSYITFAVSGWNNCSATATTFSWLSHRLSSFRLLISAHPSPYVGTPENEWGNAPECYAFRMAVLFPSKRIPQPNSEHKSARNRISPSRGNLSFRVHRSAPDLLSRGGPARGSAEPKIEDAVAAAIVGAFAPAVEDFEAAKRAARAAITALFRREITGSESSEGRHANGALSLLLARRPRSSSDAAYRPLGTSCVGPLTFTRRSPKL